ncbi:putative GTP-binding protein 6-like, partial [Apostichopus japonicus]
MISNSLNSSDSSNSPEFNDVHHDRLLDSIQIMKAGLKERKPGEPHRVFVLQPHIKSGPRKGSSWNPKLQLDESISLVRTLKWTILDSAVYSTTQPGKKTIFGKGTYGNITERLADVPGLTAVFISLDRLNSIQQKELEDCWKVAIYDRYSLVLEIFKLHARTREAKLQIALAEIPLLRSRLLLKDENFDQQSGAQRYIGGGGETFLEVRQRVLAEREIKIKKSLRNLQMKRGLLRKERAMKQFPVISVVGYTNAGKTSLIRKLTGDADLQPKDELFATLDVTSHRGTLPNGMSAIFVDTVGFISNLPHDLIASFSATLEDVLLSDVIIHVRDVSHPDTEAQKANVLRVLQDLGLSETLLGNMMEVCNKSDLLTDSLPAQDGGQSHLISATEGTGIEDLKTSIQEHILSVTDTVVCTLRIPMNGGHL